MILVTGGAGFIGSHLVQALQARGEPVRVLDDLSSGRRENLGPALGRVELVLGDLADLELVRRAVEGCSAVLHQGARPSVERSIQDPLATHRANANGTLNLLLAARDAGVRRVVLASSSSVYGDSPSLPKSEEDPPQPKSPYALSKLAAELYAQQFWRLYQLETVTLRYFNVYGPRQDPESEYAAVVPRFIRAALRGEPATIFGDGGQTRDFTFIGDVVRANLLALTSAGAVGEVLNIAAGQQISVKRLHTLIGRIAGCEIAPRHAPARAGEVRDSQAATGRAEQLLGFRTEIPLEKGLGETVDYFRRLESGSLRAGP
jgi:nucleoside-diphosphate-sugar epimerase